MLKPAIGYDRNINFNGRSRISFVFPIIDGYLEGRLSVERNVDVVGDVPPRCQFAPGTPGHHHLHHPVDVEQGLGAGPHPPPCHVDRLHGLHNSDFRDSHELLT